MKGVKIEDVVYDLAKPITDEKDLDLVGVEYVKEGANWYLRVYIDKDPGVDLEDCQAVSRELSDLLDQKDPIPQAYFLEVSSPGIERILQREKDFQKFRDHLVNVHTFSPIENKKTIQGRLGPVSDQILSLGLEDGSTLEIPREKISQVRLAWVD